MPGQQGPKKKRKKKIHKNTKPLGLVTVGQPWDSCQRP